MRIFIGWGDDWESFPETAATTLEELYLLLWGLDTPGAQTDRQLIIMPRIGETNEPCIVLQINDTELKEE